EIARPVCIRVYGIRGDRNAEREERAARIATAQAAIDVLQRELPKLKHPKEVAQAQHLVELDERRRHFHSANADRRTELEAVLAGERRLALAALEAGRRALFSVRGTDVI